MPAVYLFSVDALVEIASHVAVERHFRYETRLANQTDNLRTTDDKSFCPEWWIVEDQRKPSK